MSPVNRVGEKKKHKKIKMRKKNGSLTVSLDCERIVFLEKSLLTHDMVSCRQIEEEEGVGEGCTLLWKGFTPYIPLPPFQAAQPKQKEPWKKRLVVFRLQDVMCMTSLIITT